MDNYQQNTTKSENKNGMIYISLIIFSVLFGFVSFMPILGTPSFITMDYEYSNLFVLLQSSISASIKTPLIIIFSLWCAYIIASIIGLQIFVNRNSKETRFVIDRLKFGKGNWVIFPVFCVFGIWLLVWLTTTYEVVILTDALTSGGFISVITSCCFILLVALTPMLIYNLIFDAVTKKRYGKKSRHKQSNKRSNERKNIRTISSAAGMIIIQAFYLVLMLVANIIFMVNVNLQGYFELGFGSIIWIVIISLFLFLMLYFAIFYKRTPKPENIAPNIKLNGIFSMISFRTLLGIGIFIVCITTLIQKDPVNVYFHDKNVQKIEIGMKTYEVQNLLGSPVNSTEDDQWIYYVGEFKHEYESYVCESTSFAEKLEKFNAIYGTEHIYTEIGFTDGIVSSVIYDKKHIYNEFDTDVTYTSENGYLYYTSTNQKVEALDAISTPNFKQLVIEKPRDYYYRAELDDGGFICRILTVTPTLQNQEEKSYISWYDGLVSAKAYITLNNSILDSEGNYTIAEGTKRISALHLKGIDKDIKTITIPETVISIERDAFKNCVHLLENKNGVLYVGDWIVGAESHIQSVTIDLNVEGIADYAFSNCRNLHSVKISSTKFSLTPEYGTLAIGITRIPDGAFIGCESLKEISIPSIVTYIGESAFENCINLTKVTIECEKEVLSYLNKISDRAFYGCIKLSKFETESVIPTTPVLPNQGSFSSNKITIPSSVESIGAYAFYKCKLIEEIEFKNGVKTIKEYAFSDCSSLSKITVPLSVTVIELGAFSNCDYPTIYCEAKTRPDGWSSFGPSANVIYDYKNN